MSDTASVIIFVVFLLVAASGLVGAIVLAAVARDRIRKTDPSATFVDVGQGHVDDPFDDLRAKILKAWIAFIVITFSATCLWWQLFPVAPPVPVAPQSIESPY